MTMEKKSQNWKTNKHFKFNIYAIRYSVFHPRFCLYRYDLNVCMFNYANLFHLQEAYECFRYNLRILTSWVKVTFIMNKITWFYLFIRKIISYVQEWYSYSYLASLIMLKLIYTSMFFFWFLCNAHVGHTHFFKLCFNSSQHTFEN